MTFVVKDIVASVAWWKEKLGFKEWLRSQPPKSAAPSVVLLRCGEVCIELLDGSKAATGVTKPGTELTGVQGFCQTSWVVDDAEACRQALVKLGVQVWQHPPGQLLTMLGGPKGLGPNLNMCFFWDLDGNEFELWSGQVAGGVFTDGKVIERY